MRLEKEVCGVDLYGVLGVTREATPAEIRAAYRREVRVSHPDLNPGDDRAGERTARLNLAGRVLLDPYLRSAYDRLTPLGAGAATASAAWYERAPADANVDWVAPRPAATQRPRGRRLGKFLREVRSFDARLSVAFQELVAKTPPRARLPLFAACILCAIGLIACAHPSSLNPWSDGTNPTSVPLSAVNH